MIHPVDDVGLSNCFYASFSFAIENKYTIKGPYAIQVASHLVKGT